MTQTTTANDSAADYSMEDAFGRGLLEGPCPDLPVKKSVSGPTSDTPQSLALVGQPHIFESPDLS